jgi:hypothetical protein
MQFLVTQKSKQRVVYVVNLGWYCWWDQDVSFERQWFCLKKVLKGLDSLSKWKKATMTIEKKKKSITFLICNYIENRVKKQNISPAHYVIAYLLNGYHTSTCLVNSYHLCIFHEVILYESHQVIKYNKSQHTTIIIYTLYTIHSRSLYYTLFFSYDLLTYKYQKKNPFISIKNLF